MRFASTAVLALACLVATLAPATSASAADEAFPVSGRTITLLVPYGAGGMVDVMGRTLARHWDDKWGTKTVVLNKPGANGQLAYNEMLRQKPDGYTIAFTQAFDTQMSYLDADATAPYSRSSFIPVGLTQRTPAPWVVRADSPIRTAQDFLDAVKAQPGKINMGSPAARGPAILYAQALQDKLGVTVNVVPFNDVPSTINALLGGHIDIATANAAVALPHIKAGRLRAVMVGGSKTLKYFPDAVSSVSAGFNIPDFSNTGLAVAKGTPPAVVQAWSAMLKEIAANPELRNQMDQAGVNLDYVTPEEYARLWIETEESVSKVLVRVAGKARTPN